MLQVKEEGFTVEDTGEIIEPSHRWEMIDEFLEILEKKMMKERKKISSKKISYICESALLNLNLKGSNITEKAPNKLKF